MSKGGNVEMNVYESGNLSHPHLCFLYFLLLTAVKTAGLVSKKLKPLRSGPIEKKLSGLSRSQL